MVVLPSNVEHDEFFEGKDFHVVVVKDIEADLDYMASEERYNGQVQRASASYQVKFDSDADRTRGDNYNKLQEYDEFKQNARIAARKQSDELNAKLQKLKSLLATPTGN